MASTAIAGQLLKIAMDSNEEVERMKDVILPEDI